MLKNVPEYIIKRFDSLDVRFDNIEESLDKLENRMDNLDTVLSNLVTRVVAMEIRFENKINILEERTAYLPKLYDRIDKLMGEIITNREERVFLNNRIDNHDKRLHNLEI